MRWKNRFNPLFAAAMMTMGCSERKENPDTTNPLANHIDRSVFYIDSVPEGADVYLVDENKKDGSDMEVVGKTPLTIKASVCNGKSFFICMKMDFYLSKLEKIPAMKDWVEKFKSDQYFQSDYGTYVGYFDFDTPVTRSMKTVDDNKLFATGPVYKLDNPMCNRECAIFLPKGMDVSTIYGLMPPPGTFGGFNENWKKTFAKYRFSEKQIIEAIECLSRCGKYITQVKNPFKKDKAMEYVITMQKGKSDLVVVTQLEVNVY